MKFILLFTNVFIFLLSASVTYAQVTIQGKVSYPDWEINMPVMVNCLDESAYTSVKDITISIENLNTNTTVSGVSGVSGFSIVTDPGPIRITPDVCANHPPFASSPLDPLSWRYNLTVTDNVVLASHINNFNILPCPFARISGDVNNDGILDALDNDLISQLIIQLIDSVPGNLNWRFISAAYVKPRADHPYASFLQDFWDYPLEDFSQPFTANLMLYQDDYAYLEQPSVYYSWMEKVDKWIVGTECEETPFDFYIIKTGNVNRSTFGTPPSSAFDCSSGNSNSSYSNLLKKEKEHIYLFASKKAGKHLAKEGSANTPDGGANKFEITVEVESSENIVGYQIGIKTNPAMADTLMLKNTSSAFEQESKNFNLKKEMLIDQGMLLSCWVQKNNDFPSGVDATNKAILFSMEMEAIDNTITAGQLINNIQLDDSFLNTFFVTIDQDNNAKIIDDVQIHLTVTPL